MCGIWGASVEYQMQRILLSCLKDECGAHMDVIVCLPHLPFREHVPIRKVSLSPQERSQL